MQKVLIISYFFPPCNLPASNRALGWAKYLHQFGYYPIIITRSWDNEIINPNDILKKSGTTLVISKKESHEVHYLPYLPTLRDRVQQKSNLFNKITSKVLTFFELIYQNYSISILGHKNIYLHTKEIIQNNAEINKMIITANPFNLFYFGYKIKKEFNINWIADYRDDWTTSELKENNSLLIHYLIKILERKSEKKWVKTASTLTTISNYYKEKLSAHIGIAGEVIKNGFFFLEDNLREDEDKDYFRITYNGSLYFTQKIEIFISAVLEFINENNNPKIKINFPGLAYSKIQLIRIQRLIKGFESYFFFSNRISKGEVIAMQKKSHVLLMVGHSNLKGIPSSKIYEYISLQKPILLVPNDNDIIEETINKAGIGFIANSKEQAKEIITDMYVKVKSNQPIINNLDKDRLQQFSRRNSTKKLAEILNSL